MKKITKTLLLALLCINLFALPLTVSAEGISNTTATTNSDVEYLDNGDYIITTIAEDDATPVTRATSTKSGKKTIRYYSASDTVLWSFTVNGTFSYNGTSSTCTKVSCSYSINSTAWKNAVTSTSKSLNTGKASITIKQYRLGLVVSTVSRTATLSCSKTGTLS